jgi:hypothetical protein
MRIDDDLSAEYIISGPQRDVIYFGEKLDHWIASCRQWYSAFFSSNLGVIPAIAAFFLPFLAANWVSKNLPLKFGSISPLPIVVFCAVILLEIGIYNLFPRGTFAIGYGLKRHRIFSFVRVSVIVAFLVSFAASALWTLLSQR